MRTRYALIILMVFLGELLLSMPALGQSNDSANETGIIPSPEEDAFASIKADLKSPRKKEQEKEKKRAPDVQPDAPVLDKDDYELYTGVVSLLPDVKAALGQLEEVVRGRMALSMTYKPGPVIYYLWGNLYFQKGEYEAALEKYEAALEIFPNYRKVCIDAGKVAIYLGLKDKAILYLERGLMAEGVVKDARIVNLLADLYYDRGSMDTAIKTYKETITQDAKDLHAHLRLAWIYYNRGEYDETLSYSLRAISLGGGNKDTYLIIARIYEERGKPQAALTALEQARFFDPEDRSLRHFQLILLDQLGLVPEIISLARGLLEEDDQDVLAWRFLADAYSTGGYTWEAISAFETLLLLDGEETGVRLRLATLYLGEELPSQSAKELMVALDAPGNQDLSAEILAISESLLSIIPENIAGSFLDSVESWAKSNSTEDSERILVMMRVRFLLNREQYDAARSILRAYIERKPEDALARLLMGDLESRSGNLIDARIHLDRAARDNEIRPDALLKLGLLELRQGNAEESLNYLSEAYSLQPTPQLKRYILRLCRHYETDPVLIFPDL